MNRLNKDALLAAQAGKTLSAPHDPIGHNDAVHETVPVTQNDWLKENIPFIDTPDARLNEIYYFRWRNLLSAMGKRRSDGKYEWCESGPGTDWYHTYIDCAQGAHVREARWIRDNRYLNDYLDVTPDTTRYREFLADSVWQKYLLDGDASCLSAQYDKLKRRLSSLDASFDAAAGLYHCTNNIEGEEAGVNGFDRAERTFLYKATYTAAGSSLDALTDNRTASPVWSCRGSDHAEDAIRVTISAANVTVTGLRVFWAEDAAAGLYEPASFYVDYETADGSFHRVEHLSARKLSHPAGATELTFSPVVTHTLRLAFENDPARDRYTGLGELCVLYRMEPWGCDNWWITVAGDETYRVGVNAYEAAACRALSRMACVLDRPAEAASFAARADGLQRALLDRLWDEKQSFFVERPVGDAPFAGGRESVGYVPWLFSLVPDEPAYAEAWRYAMDENGFLSPFGLTSLDRSHPHYMQDYNHGCMWNGPVWPYTFSQVLTAMANLLATGHQQVVTAADFRELLARYLRCHYDSGTTDRLILREDHHPEENRWLSPAPQYNHSTGIDPILNGLFGLRPEEDGLMIVPLVAEDWDWFAVEDVAFAGHTVALSFDRDGRHFGDEAGFAVAWDGETVFRAPTVTPVFLSKTGAARRV